MPRKLRAVDISHVPELLRIAEEVRASGEPRVLRRRGEDLAILTPPKPRRKPTRARTSKDLDAFRSAAGGWKDVDTDRLLADIHADRRVSDRPPVEL